MLIKWWAHTLRQRQYDSNKEHRQAPTRIIDPLLPWFCLFSHQKPAEFSHFLGSIVRGAVSNRKVNPTAVLYCFRVKKVYFLA